MDILKRLRTLLGLLLLSLLTACTDTNESAESHQTAQSSPAEQLIVYKSPKCGCCKKWMERINAQGEPAHWLLTLEEI